MNSALLAQASAPEARLILVLDRLVSDSLADSEADAVGLHLFDPAEQAPVSVAFRGRLRSRLPVAEEVGERLLGGWCDGRSLPLEPECLDVPAGGAPVPVMRPGCRSLIRIPLVEGRRCSGVLQLEAERPRAFGAASVAREAARAAYALPALYRALLQERLGSVSGPSAVIGSSAAFLDFERKVRMVGCFSQGSVLITGERGSGKEWTAWAVHCLSRRRSAPLVPVLASALPESLLADELFGHEKHAFTGAETTRRGRFEEADGGTLFLDEVGD
ncbi:MAG TPA: sigma 54-interacting transcriptional regulator, partial [Thermoanaerobaculia bacterium]